jgi:EpsI family protein
MANRNSKRKQNILAMHRVDYALHAKGSLLILFLAWMYSFGPTISAIYQNNVENSDSIRMSFIIVLSAAIAILRRNILVRISPYFSQGGLFALFFLLVAWGFAYVLNITILERILVLLILPSILLTSCGIKITLVMLPSLLLLLLCLPVGQELHAMRSILEHISLLLLLALLLSAVVILYKRSKWCWFILGRLNFYTHRCFSAFSTQTITNSHNFRWFLPTSIATCMLLAFPWFAENIKNNPWDTDKQEILLYAPHYIPNWAGPFEFADKIWKPSFVGADKTVAALYKNTEGDVYLYTAYFSSPLEKDGLSSNSNALYRSSVWQIQERNRITIAPNLSSTDKSMRIPAQEQVLSSANGGRLMWSWYYVGTFVSPNHSVIRLLEGVRIISNISDHSGVVAITTEIDVDLATSRKRLRQFMNDLYPQIQLLMHPTVKAADKEGAKAQKKSYTTNKK